VKTLARLLPILILLIIGLLLWLRGGETELAETSSDLETAQHSGEPRSRREPSGAAREMSAEGEALPAGDGAANDSDQPAREARISEAAQDFWSNRRMDQAIENAWADAQAGDPDARFHVAVGLEICLRRLVNRERDPERHDRWGMDPCPDFTREDVARYADAAGYIEALVEQDHAPTQLWLKSRGLGNVDRLSRSIADVLEGREEIRFEHQDDDRAWQTPDPEEVLSLMEKAGPDGVSWGLQALSRSGQLNEDVVGRGPLMALTVNCILGADCGPETASWEALCGGGDLGCREDRSLEENLEMVMGPEAWQEYRDHRQQVEQLIRSNNYRPLITED